MLPADVLREAGMEGGNARHGGHDADAGKHPRYSFAQCELLTTTGFPAIIMERFATILQQIAIYTLSMDFTSDS